MTGRSVSSSWRHSAEEDTAYRIVIASDECPRSSCNSFSMTPSRTAQDANVCLRVWKFTSSSFAIATPAPRGAALIS